MVLFNAFSAELVSDSHSIDQLLSDRPDVKIKQIGSPDSDTASAWLISGQPLFLHDQHIYAHFG